MKYTIPGQHRTAEELRAHLRQLDPAFDAVPELSGGAGPLGRPLRLGDRTIGNRWAIHPMEGWDGTPEGLPTEATLRRWRHFGKSTASTTCITPLLQSMFSLITDAPSTRSSLSSKWKASLSAARVTAESMLLIPSAVTLTGRTW